MGRETVAVCHWQDHIAEVRLHLDSNALSLRGDICVDTMVRTHMRALGFIDSKTSAVSDQLTTTRYRLRQP